MSNEQPKIKIYPGGALSCPVCGEHRMFISFIGEAAPDDWDPDEGPHYSVECGNLDCIWRGEL